MMSKLDQDESTVIPGLVGLGTVSMYTRAKGSLGTFEGCLGVHARAIVAIGHEVQKWSLVATQ